MLKYLNEPPAYNNCYHFVASSKYRNDVFLDGDVRESLIDFVKSKSISMNLDLLAVTVAYNHIHILVKGDELPAKIAQGLFGFISFSMRKKYIQLKNNSDTSLWGGTSCNYIRDEQHLLNTISYIERHQPDNTKIEI